MPESFDALVRRLAADAQAVDRAGSWSPQVAAALSEAGAWGWVLPRSFGGAERGGVEQVAGYEAVACGSMTAALILTQHDAACQLIIKGESESLKQDVLPRCATGKLLATVGISQLTTSRRFGGPAMRARADGDGFRLDGAMPWVTSAPHCGLIVTGGVLDDGRQILAALPRERAGVEVQTPFELAALQASATCEVRCRDVRIEPRELIRGPVEQVLSRRAPVKSLTVSATGIGHAGSLAAALTGLRERSPESLAAMVRQLESEHQRVRGIVYAAAEQRRDEDAEVPAAEIRGAVNDLLIRLAAAQLMLSKGSGMLRDHPAQRLAREALFFLVWSAPEEVQAATLGRLVGAPSESALSK